MFKCKHCGEMVSLRNNNPFQMNHRDEWDNADTTAVCACGTEYKVIIIDQTARRKHEAAVKAYRASHQSRDLFGV